MMLLTSYTSNIFKQTTIIIVNDRNKKTLWIWLLMGSSTPLDSWCLPMKAPHAQPSLRSSRRQPHLEEWPWSNMCPLSTTPLRFKQRKRGGKMLNFSVTKAAWGPSSARQTWKEYPEFLPSEKPTILRHGFAFIYMPTCIDTQSHTQTKLGIYIYIHEHIYIHVCIERKRWGFPTAMFDYWRRLLTKPTSFKPRGRYPMKKRIYMDLCRWI
jgi:hypothetical protein